MSKTLVHKIIYMTGLKLENYFTDKNFVFNDYILFEHNNTNDLKSYLHNNFPSLEIYRKTRQLT